MLVFVCILAYFSLLLVVSHFTTRSSSNETFFSGERNSPWYVVSFGMIGASVSAVTFVSVPGMVLHSDMTYLQTCMGFILGYFAVAYILLPIYYRLQLTSIYTYLQNISGRAYRTGASFFILSKLLGSAAKFYVPCYIISNALHCSFALTAFALLLLVWLYTRRGGIKTLVWTDTLQTTFMLVALVLIIYNVYDSLTSGAAAMTFTEVAEGVIGSSYSNVFNFSDWSSSTNFFKCFVSGIFIVIVMTGLDQDMMQKNLTCKTMHDARKDMCTYGFAFVPVNALFLLLGILLTMHYARHGMPLPDKADALLSNYVMSSSETLSTITYAAFMIGVVSTSFSTIDSALTALTTTVCVDIIGKGKENGSRTRRGMVHLVAALLLAVCCILFDYFNTTSLIDAVYKLVSYTYGPLLGLFAYAILCRHGKSRPASWIDRLGGEALVCVTSPLICLFLDIYVPEVTGYHFGYELLMLNGMLTFVGLCIMHKPSFTFFRLKK